MSTTINQDSRLGMTGREDSWNYQDDQLWEFEYSANELILIPGLDQRGEPRGPGLSAQRALGLLIERFGPDRVRAAVDEMTAWE